MWTKFFTDVNPTMSRSICGQKTSVQDIQKRTGVDHSPDAPMSYPDSASRRTSGTGKALPPLFHKGQLRMRVPRDREQRFQTIVSTFWKVLEASADNSTGLRVSHSTNEEARCLPRDCRCAESEKFYV